MKNNPLVSIIIPVFNSKKFIKKNLRSIFFQKYKKIEIIIIDNKSTDGTLNAIPKNKKIKIVSEKDDGIYDAMNKGIKLSKGSIVTVLNSDDFYSYNSVISEIVNLFKKKPNVMCIYGNLVYVSRNNVRKIVRVWKSSIYKPNLFLYGWNPPHPTLFLKKECFKICGLYKNNIGNAADIEFMFKVFSNRKLSTFFYDKELVKMRAGGSSNKSFYSILIQNISILKFLKIYKNPYLVVRFIVFKLFNRISQIYYAKYL